jgi:4-amino-4-deoxy-L-arabinose transferase-like glycosyltransferase
MFLPALGSVSIIDSSEGYYSEASREMYELADYVTPHLNYRPWFEKPALTYWLVSASYHALGVNEFAARLPAALCGIFTAGLLFVFCRRFMSRRAAFLSALVLLSTPFFLVVGRLCLTDMPLTLCVTAALAGLFCAIEGASVRCAVLGYVALGLGFLAKGPLAVVLAGIVIVPYLCWTCTSRQDWQLKLSRLRPLLGAAVLILVAAPWYVAVSLATKGAFAQDFFIDQNLGRAAGTAVHRNLHLWYYLPVFWAGSAPWSIMLLPGAGALARNLRRRKDASRRTRALQYCTIWLVMMFLFFSVVPTKLSTYILPTFPAFAVCVGASLDSLMRWRHVRRFSVMGMLLCVALIVLLALLPLLSKFVAGMIVSAVIMLVALLCALGLYSLALWRNQAKRAFSYLTAIILAATAVAVPAGIAIYHRLHQEGFYRLVLAAAQSNANVAFIVPSAFSSAFYLHKRVPELKTREDFQEFLNDGNQRHWVFVHKHSLERLSWAERPARLIESQDRWYLFAVADDQGNRH